MTPKEKAEELMDAMLGYGDEYHHCTQYVAKKCALIAADEIIGYSRMHGFIGLTEYWQQVKNEIDKL
jgi:hypothetical protein